MSNDVWIDGWIASTAAAVCLLLPLAAGCVDDGDDPLADDGLGEMTAEITGGTLVSSNVAPYNSVVRISSSGGGCTATKIGARRFITAAHCTDEGLAVGDDVSITNALDGTFPADSTFAITRLDRHPTWVNDPDNDGGFDNSRAYDIAIISIGVDTPAIPALTVRGAYLDAGTQGRTVGYGCDASSTNDGQKQRATFTAMSLSAYQTLSSADDDFDYSRHTYNTIHNGGATVQTCPGDSGGPQLVQDAAGTWQVAALTSSHNSDVSFQARVGGASRWISSPTVNSFTSGSSGYFLNGKSNLCIGVDGASTANGARVGQYYCDGRRLTADNQFWTLVALGDGWYRIKNGKSGRCLGVAGGSTANGAQLAQYTCEAVPGNIDNQAWRFEQNSAGKFRIKNGKSGRCVGVDGASTVKGTHLSQYTCDGFANQGWIFTR